MSKISVTWRSKTQGGQSLKPRPPNYLERTLILMDKDFFFFTFHDQKMFSFRVQIISRFNFCNEMQAWFLLSYFSFHSNCHCDLLDPRVKKCWSKHLEEYAHVKWMYIILFLINLWNRLKNQCSHVHYYL